MVIFNQPIKKWRITIIGGTGAVGAYFCKQLVQDDHCVSIIGKANSPHLKQIQMDGPKLITSEGTGIMPAKKFNYIGDLAHFPKQYIQDLVIVSLKQYDLSVDIVKQILEITDEHSIIGIIANGLPFYFLRGLNLSKKYLECVDEGGKIAQLLENRQIIGIQPIIASRIVSPGVIHISRDLTKITVTLGSPEQRITRKMQDLHALFTRAKIATVMTEDGLHKNILEKQQFSLSINTLSGIMKKTIGEIFDSEETQPLIIYSITLINQMAMALNVGALRNYTQFKAIAITKSHFSSLYHDLQEGKPGEVKAIVDALIELAEFLKDNNPLAIPIPDLEPLKVLKSLLTQARTTEASHSQLMKLFDSCRTSLSTLAENVESAAKEIPTKSKIRSKL